MSEEASPSGGWAAEQLTAYLSALASVSVEDVLREAIERAAEGLDAEVAALVVAGTVEAVVGFPRGQVPVGHLLELARTRPAEATLPGVGCCRLLAVPFDDSGDGWLMVARAGLSGFSLDERNLLRGMSRVLSLTRREKRALADERQLREIGERAAADKVRLLAALTERQTLLERLTRIQRSITSRSPLPDVLQAVVTGAAELIGDAIVGFRRLDPNDANYAEMVCSSGVDSESALGERIRVGDGAGGRAISEDRLVVLHDYADNPAALQSFAAVGLQAAMAAPVHEDGAVVGSLVVASHRPGRRYSPVEQDMLLSFADHASLAVTDARMVSTLRKALDDARHDAMHDVLTGLPNRALLRDRLTQAWARAHRRNSLVAVLFLDLDGFKHVNDSLGHDVGDQLLMAVGARLGIRLRDADTVARMGGDEFAVIIEDVDAIDQVEEVAERLLEMLADPIVVDNREVAVNASIGIAVAAGDETDGRALLRNADLAMYEAKRSGGARFVVYRAEMHRTTVERLDLEQALRRALTTDELLLHYQPIHDIASGRIVSVEALVRWRHPVRGVISPAEFIPIAESSRLIGPLGEWVLREACAQAARWPADIQVAVNVSPLQIDSCLVPTVRRILAETGLSPHRLKLEVTEGTAMADVPETMEVIADLHREGIHFAIDDFGTGHSSLARLRRLPIDQLKIDRSFVEDLADPGGAVLVSAIIALARGAGLVAVAEGVETDAQLQQLRELGCDQAQGFLFARPADAAVVTQLILASERARLQPAVPAPLPLPLPLPLPRTKPATIPR